jgi:predicted RNA-binding Zn ribbon-like protein
MNEIKKNAATISFLGGRLSLDFTNTIEWRGRDNPMELLLNYQDLVPWSRRQGTLTDQEAQHLLETANRQKDLGFSVYKRAIALREALYHIFSNIIQARQPLQTDLTIFNQELASAMAKSQVSPTSEGFKWQWTGHEDQLDRIFWPIVHDAATLLTSDILPRLGMCSDKNCAWLFLDTSKNHKRRWCSMDDCGNRAKFQRHYKRKQSNIQNRIK